MSFNLVSIFSLLFRGVGVIAKDASVGNVGLDLQRAGISVGQRVAARGEYRR